MRNKFQFVWIVEVSGRRDGGGWSAWSPTGMEWYLTRRGALVQLRTFSSSGLRYRVKKYVPND